jgi:hypothetical protein
MAHGDAREGKWRGNWRMEGVSITLYTTSEHGVSSITTTDAHASVASSRLNWRPRRFKWTRPFRRKTKSGFCACAVTVQTQSASEVTFLPPQCQVPLSWNSGSNHIVQRTFKVLRCVCMYLVIWHLTSDLIDILSRPFCLITTKPSAACCHIAATFASLVTFVIQKVTVRHRPSSDFDATIPSQS